MCLGLMARDPKTGTQRLLLSGATSMTSLVFYSHFTELNKRLRGPILKSQCYGRAKVVVKAIKIEKQNYYGGAQHVVNVIQKRDPLSFVTEVFTEFYASLSTRHSVKENVKNY